MAKADLTIDPRIRESARQEFLALGFEKASLKRICARAEVTTGALYKRYQGKADLFHAVVADTVADLNAVIRQKTEIDARSLSDAALVAAWDMDEAYMLWWFRFLYARHDGFVLLLRGAEGTEYANFQHDWVEKMTDGSFLYYAEALRRGLARVELSRSELHILLTGFWSTIYEPFIHGYDWAQITAHCRVVCRLFDWKRALGLDCPAEETSP